MFARFRSWFRATSRRGQMEQQMSQEMESHIEHRVADLISRGIAPAEAQRRARVEFGAAESFKEEARAARGLSFGDELVRNVKFALRQLRKTPAFTITAVLTLALCIGANTIIYSLVDTMLLRPLPYPEPENLGDVVIHAKTARSEWSHEGHNGTVFELVRDSVAAVRVAAYSGSGGVNLAVGNQAQYVRQQRVSADYFSVLGVAPAIGRSFSAAEDRVGGPAVTVLSHSLWQRVFQGDPMVLGRSVMLRGEPHIVVGIMPADFRTPSDVELWTPLRPSRTGEGGGSNYGVLARLRPGVTWPQAQTELAPLSRAVADAMRMSPQATPRLALRPTRMMSSSGVREVLLVLWAAVGTVLLIGCVNIAGLLLARGAHRRREMATRLALGGSRGAMIRQLLTESAVLAVIGGGLGIALAYAGLAAISPHLELGLGIPEKVFIDWRVLAVTIPVTLLTSVLFGLFPAWHSSRTDIRSALVEGGGQGIIGARGHWPRRLLLVFEVALGVLLLVVATQFTRTFLRLAALTPGFDSTGVYVASLSLQDARYAKAEVVNQLFNRTLTEIRTLHGVSHAAVALTLPYQRALNNGFRVADGPSAMEEMAPTNTTYVTPEYFRALAIPLLKGRTLQDSDGPDAPPVAVVNAAFAQHYLKGQEPIGTHLRMAGRDWQIVGVIGNTLEKAGWGNYGPLQAIPGVYLAAAQQSDAFFTLVHTWFSPSWIVRTNGTARDLRRGMQQAVAASDPLLPFSSFRAMDQVRGNALARQRFEALTVNSFAALGLLLSAIGIGGLIASSVAERWREMAVRMALGASHGRAIRTIAMPGIVLTFAGLATGLLLAYPAMTAIRKLVWGIQPSHPANFLVAAAALLTVALVASFAPAIRLRRLNVADTLREG